MKNPQFLSFSRRALRWSIVGTAFLLGCWIKAFGQSLTPPATKDEIVRDLASSTPAADPASYLTIRELVSGAPERYNGVMRTTRTVYVKGVSVVIDASKVGNLHQQFNGAQDAKLFVIEADTITVKNAFAVAARFEIRARELKFEGSSTGPDAAAFITTPTQPVAKAGIGEDGEDGFSGGDIQLVVGSISVPAGTESVVRFFTSGSKGGIGGRGADGTDGVSMVPVSQFPQPSKIGNADANQQGLQDNTIVYLDHKVAGSKQDPVHVAYYGSPGYPTSGTDARAGGRPGKGGAGGSVTSTVPVAKMTSTAGGLSAPPAGAYKGGAAGTPTSSCWAVLDQNTNGYYYHPWPDTGYVMTKAGASVTSPAASAPQGASGTTTQSGDVARWLPVDVAQARLAYATDAYRRRQFTVARAELDALAAQLAANIGSAEDRVAAGAVASQVETYRLQLQANRTIDNWPINSVPIFNLQTAVAIMDQEVGRAVNIFYLDLLVSDKARTLQEKVQAIAQSRQALVDDTNQLAASMPGLVAEIITLQNESEAMGQEGAQIQLAAKLISEEQVRDAQAMAANDARRARGPAFQQITRMIATIAQMTPVSAPIGELLGFAGNAVQTLTSIKSDSPFTAIATIADLAKTATPLLDKASPASLSKSFDTYWQQLQKLNPSTIGTAGWPAYMQNYNAVMGPIDNGIKSLQGSLAATSVPSSVIQKYFADIQASEPALANLGKRAEALAARKEAFAQNLANKIGGLSKTRDQVSGNLLAMSAFDRQLSGNLAVMDPDVVKRVGDLARQAATRLVTFQAIVASAYEYVTLQSYPGNLDASKVISRVQALLQSGTGPLKSADVTALVSTYRQDLSQVVASLVQYSQLNYSPLAVPVSYDLTPAEIAALNRGETVRINIKRAGLIRGYQDDVQILDAKFSNVEGSVTSGNANGQFAELTVFLRQPGICRRERAGIVYEHVLYPNDTLNPISWGVVRDLKRNRTTPISVSLSAATLLSNLVGSPVTPGASVSISPGADSELELTVAPYSDTGAKIQLDRLTIDFTLQSSNARRTQTTLEVSASNGFKPAVQTSVKDVYGRGPGTATMSRLFATNSTVSVKFESAIQLSPLVGFEDRFGNRLKADANDPTSVTVSLSQPTAVVGVYGPPSSESTSSSVAVTTQPTAQQAAPGQSARFSVGTTGTAGATFRWQQSNDGGATWTSLSDNGVFSGTNSSTLAVLPSATMNGSLYRAVISSSGGTVTTSSARLDVVGGVRAVNLSTRAQTTSGAGITTAGFAIAGSTPKQVLIRGAGPALAKAPINLTGTVVDPTLTLFNGNTVIAANNDWNSPIGTSMIPSSMFSLLGAFPFDQGSRDSAILVTLSPGLYTVQLGTATSTNATGIGLIEVYETDSGGGLLTNLSTRGFVGTGNAIMIAGLAVSGGQGGATQRFLVRAAGPTLGSFGVTGTLADPIITITDSAGRILASNNNWDVGGAVSADEIATIVLRVGAFGFPRGSRDAALVVDLPPGNYGVQVTGGSNGTGLAIVEVYVAP